MKKITIMNLHLGVGGIENYVSGLTRMLDNNYEIELIVTYKLKDKPSFPISNRVNIKYLIDGGPNREEIKRCFKRKKYKELVIELINAVKILLLKRSRTKKAIKGVNSDYIITTRTYETKLVSKLLKNSNIVKIATDHNYPTKKYKKELIRATKNIDKLVVVNDEIKKIYEREIGKKVICINNFIDNISDKTANLNNKNIISVGRFSKEKDFISLIEIMELVVRENKDIHLTLVGDGVESANIKDKIKELNLESNIELTGYLSSVEIEEKMAKSSLYAMTSLTESFGLVLVEAMSVGLPIISFDTGSGPKELLKDGTGILISNRDKEEFARRIINLFNNRKELSILSKKSKEKVKIYTMNNVKKEWINLLNETLDKSNKRVMFISSTGGHLNELLMLKSMFSKYKYSLVTEKTKTNESLKEEYGSKNMGYLVYGTRKHMLTYPFKFAYNIFKSLYYFIKFKPEFIVSTGTHTAVPMILIAHIFKKKVIYIETFANIKTKTLTGEFVYKYVDLFIVQWESMLKLYPKSVYGGWIY